MTVEESKRIIDILDNERAAEIQNLKDAFNLWNEQGLDFTICHVNITISYLYNYYEKNGTTNAIGSRVFLDPNDISNVVINLLNSEVFYSLQNERDVRELLNQLYLVIMSSILFFKWRTKFSGASISNEDTISVVNTNYNEDIQINWPSSVKQEGSVFMFVNLNNDKRLIGYISFKVNRFRFKSNLNDLFVHMEVQNTENKVIDSFSTRFADLSMLLFKKRNFTAQDFM